MIMESNPTKNVPPAQRRERSLLRRRSTSSRSDLLDVRGLQPLGPVHHFEFHRITFAQGAESVRYDRGMMYEHVLAAFLRDESEALRVIEPLHRTLRHCYNLMLGA